MLRSTIVWFTWVGAALFLPVETYLSFSKASFPLSGYTVNVLGVVIALWGTVSMRKGKVYAEGLLATGFGWTTAAAWRATNLRYWLAEQGEPLTFGRVDLWLLPVLTLLAAAALIGSLKLLLTRRDDSTE